MLFHPRVSVLIIRQEIREPFVNSKYSPPYPNPALGRLLFRTQRFLTAFKFRFAEEKELPSVRQLFLLTAPLH